MMPMDSEYTAGVAHNVFAALNSDESLRVLGLSLAANDLMSNLEAMRIVPENENSYFFCNSIAIIREVAKLVERTEKSTLSQQFSEATWNSFKELIAVLAPYNDTSFAKSILKPIRDVTFHYDLAQSPAAGWDKVFDGIRKLDQLDVGLMPDNRSLRGQRYTFADLIRMEYVNQFLTKETVLQLSSVAVSIGAFVDSLLTDLVSRQQGREDKSGEGTP
jgi:hypothetical protein